MRLALLARPDAFLWQVDPDYAPAVADVLRAAFSRLSRQTPTQEEYLRACLLAGPWLKRTMALQQRVRLYHLFARAFEFEHHYEQAVTWIERALGAAERGHTSGERAELLVARARLWRAIGKYQRAADDVQAALTLYYWRAPDEEAIPPALRLELFTQLATYKFFLAHFGVAADLVEETRRLLPLAPEEALVAASARWVESHLLRTRGWLEEALELALDAAEAHTREASLTSQDRMQVYVADVCLDLAERARAHPETLDGRRYLRRAREHLAWAKHLARAAQDTPGRALITVVQTRESRLRGRQEDRVGAIERCLRTGRRLGDAALLAQGYTALGQEFASQGEHERAKHCWRQALEALDGGEIAALRLPARRALLLASEFAAV